MMHISDVFSDVQTCFQLTVTLWQQDHHFSLLDILPSYSLRYTSASAVVSAVSSTWPYVHYMLVLWEINHHWRKVLLTIAKPYTAMFWNYNKILHCSNTGEVQRKFLIGGAIAFSNNWFRLTWPPSVIYSNPM